MTDWARGLGVGQWYHADGNSFEIVAVDIENESVLVQQFDGTLEDYDFEAWMELGAKPTAEPEDWSGSMDIDREDFISDNDVMQPDRWSDPLDFLDARF